LQGAEPTYDASVQIEDGALILYGVNPDNGRQYSITLGEKKSDYGVGSAWGSTYSTNFGMGPALPAPVSFPTTQSMSQEFASNAPLSQVQPPSTAAAVAMGFVNLVPGAALANQSMMAWRYGQYGRSVALYSLSFVDAAIGVVTFGESSIIGRTTSTVVETAETVTEAAAESGKNIVYRGLAKGEDASAGLFARSPGAGNSVASHVAGARESQWISTTKSLTVAETKFGANGVVAIDLSKVTTQVVDVSAGIPLMSPTTMLSRWAIKAEEVVIQDYVPAEAIMSLP